MRLQARWTLSTTATTAVGFWMAILLLRGANVPSASAQTPTAQSPTTQSTTTQPATTQQLADSQIRRSFDRLGDPDPKVREQARIDLMGISSADLPKLRRLVFDQSPILSAQAAALHDIVIQAFLADEKYQVIGSETTIAGDQSPYFLGVRWLHEDDIDYRLGVTFDVRLPGFPSYRFLRDGDMILGIFLDPTLPLAQPPNKETHIPQELVNCISDRPDIQDIVLLVLRNGEQIRIPIRMAPRPLFPQHGTESLEDFAARRSHKAEAYWQQDFAPLLEERYAGEIAD